MFLRYSSIRRSSNCQDIAKADTYWYDTRGGTQSLKPSCKNGNIQIAQN